MMCRSVRQTPAPPIFTTTSSGPSTVGSGTSSATGCLWYSCNRTAFIGSPPRQLRRSHTSRAGNPAYAAICLQANPGRYPVEIRYVDAVDVYRAADLYAPGWTLRQIGAELGVPWI